jgi:subtilisin family serine protease
MFLTSILYLSCYVFGQNYILTPKDEYVNSFDVHKISGEHNLKIFAEFKEFEYIPFYITSKENVLKYKTTLSQFFDIEEDVTISLKNENNFVIVNENTNNIGVLNNQTIPWHLDRIVKEKLPLDGTFPYNDSGSCHQNNDIQIDTYVVDTGIDVNHPQFENRAVWANNFVDSTDTDCNNHGTHVAGLIGSKDYGVCKDANLYAVKVLDCRGSGSLSGVIKGIEWVYKTHVEKTKTFSDKKVKSIINMSLGGGFSRALNKAIEYGVKNNDNFYVVVAAGNENEDACTGSPSSVKSIFTVMASDISDNRAWFSNWGECADIYSPGVDILSTIPNGETAVYSGTSMASPVMAGVLNHYIDLHSNMNMKQIKEVVLKSSSKNVISGVKRSTTSNLIYLQRKF